MEIFVADMNLMFDNAKLYNADESQIFTDAATLQVTHSCSDANFSKLWRGYRKKKERRQIQSMLTGD